VRRLLALTLLAALASCRPARDPQEVRLGYAPNLTHAQALVGLALGDFERAIPPPYRLTATPFNAGPAMIEALDAGELDLAYLGPIPAINGFVQSGGRALRIVSGSASGGSGLVVRRGSGIESERDLAGAPSRCPSSAARRTWRCAPICAAGPQDHPSAAAPVRVLSVQNSESLTLFKKGQLDAAMVPEPWIERLVREAGGRFLVDERTLWPDGRYATTVIVARRRFLEKHPELAAFPTPRADHHRVRGRAPRGQRHAHRKAGARGDGQGPSPAHRGGRAHAGGADRGSPSRDGRDLRRAGVAARVPEAGA
jgi:NitT/TauT family transport system substrate-binding protein